MSRLMKDATKFQVAEKNKAKSAAELTQAQASKICAELSIILNKELFGTPNA